MITRNPLQIQCRNCGAALGFDIVRGSYACPSCGSVSSAEDALQEILQWRMKHKVRAGSFADASKAAYTECPGCGSRVLFAPEEAEEVCDFCGSKLLREEFLEDRVLPEIILPFRITKEEARGRLEDWGKKHPVSRERKMIREHLGSLCGYYLPYEIFRGPVSGSVRRDAGARTYTVCGFAEGTAVNMSEQLNNLVLHKAEPFDWAETAPFHPGIIAGQRVKLPNLSEGLVRQRAEAELESEFLPEVEKVMQTTGLTLNLSTARLTGIPALLPMYFLRAGNFLAVVNGQTGRVAVSEGKTVTSYPWVIEPLVYTVIATVLLSIPYHFSPRPMLLFAAVFACLFFAIFSEGRNSLVRWVIRQGKESRAVRENGEIHYAEGKDILKNPFDNTPVFIEEDKDGKEVPVQIRFYSAGRILRMFLSMGITLCLPALLAALLRLGQIAETGEKFADHFDWQYGAAWYVLGVFLCILYLVKGMRIDIYDHPILYRIREDGKKKRMYSPGSRMGGILSLFDFESIKDLGKTGWILGIGLFLLLLGSTMAIIY